MNSENQANKTILIKETGSAKNSGSIHLTPEGDLKLDEAALKALGFRLEWSEDGAVGTLTQIADTGTDLTPEELSFASEMTDFSKLIRDTAKKIYDNPEMAFKESFACDLLCAIFESHGFSLERNPKGVHPVTKEPWTMDTAFIATLDGMTGGPSIALMLEYDALPGGHACGHNLIATAGLAAALLLAKRMPQLKGRLVIYGTPGEEGKAGKAHMVEAGMFQDIDVALVSHPGDRWATGSDFLATKTATIVYKGVPSHASAAPEKGVSALDAAVITYNAIELQREHLRSDARVHGFIRDGGKICNVVPDRAEMDWAVRALDNVYMEKLANMIERCAQAGALATGAEMELSWSVPYGAPVKVPTLDHLVLDLAKAMNVGLIKSFDVLGSSDLGNVSFELPTCNLWFAIAGEGTMPHTVEFLEAAGSDEAVESVLNAGKVMALAALRLFNDPALVAGIQEEFIASKQRLIAHS